MTHKISLNLILRRLLKSGFVVLLSGCLSPFDFKADTFGGMVVISGQVSNIPDRNIVQVGITAYQRRLPYPSTGARVFVIDEFGDSIEYLESPTKPGYYYGTKPGVPGIMYFVSVELEDGHRYQSQPERMAASAGTIDVRYELVTENVVDGEGTVLNTDNIKLYGESVLPVEESPLFMKWSTEEVYQIVPTDFPDPFGNVPDNCYVTQTADPQKIVLHNGIEVVAAEINNQLLLTRKIDQSFHSRHYFTTYQSAISFEAFEYWRKVNIVANQVGSIFDSPPAEVQGNIFNIDDEDEAVAGFFQAVNQTFDRVDLVQGDLDTPLQAYCEYDPFRNYNSYPAECLDCLTARNSSLERPEWFGD